MGRRKIKIEKIVDNRARNATFNKRRPGLFKKAYELGTLCDTTVTVIIQAKNSDEKWAYTSVEDCVPSKDDIQRINCQNNAGSISSPVTKQGCDDKPIAPIPPIFDTRGLDPVLLMEVARFFTSLDTN